MVLDKKRVLKADSGAMKCRHCMKAVRDSPSFECTEKHKGREQVWCLQCISKTFGGTASEHRNKSYPECPICMRCFAEEQLPDDPNHGPLSSKPSEAGKSPTRCVGVAERDSDPIPLAEGAREEGEAISHDDLKPEHEATALRPPQPAPTFPIPSGTASTSTAPVQQQEGERGEQQELGDRGGEEVVDQGEQRVRSEPVRLADGTMNPQRPLPFWTRDLTLMGFDMVDLPTVEYAEQHDREPPSQQQCLGQCSFVSAAGAFDARWFVRGHAQPFEAKLEIWLKLRRFDSNQTMGETYRFTCRARALNLEQNSWHKPPYKLSGMLHGHPVSLHEVSEELWEALRHHTRSDAEKGFDKEAVNVIPDHKKLPGPQHLCRNLDMVIPWFRIIEEPAGDELSRSAKLEQQRRQMLPKWRSIDLPWAKRPKKGPETEEEGEAKAAVPATLTETAIADGRHGSQHLSETAETEESLSQEY